MRAVDTVARLGGDEFAAILDEPVLEQGALRLAERLLANGVTKDKTAVSAALSSGWSSGQAEGQICKLKLVKRQMYGRGKFDLLQARVIGLT